MSVASPALSTTPTPGWKNLTRWQAFAIHFALSVLIFAALVAFMVFSWFPGELFLIDGGWQGLKLVAIIDLVLGPALTLILWSPKKPSLLFDMCVVAVFQIAALAYGFVTTYEQRTVAMVFAEKEFVSLSNSDLEKANKILLEKELTPVPLSEFEPGRPRLVLTPAPNRDSFGKYITDLLNGYPDAFKRNDQYVNISEGRDEMKQSALDQAQLEDLGWLESVQKEVADKGFNEEDLEFYRFETRYAKGVAMFDLKKMDIVDYLPLKASSTQTAETLVDE